MTGPIMSTNEPALTPIEYDRMRQAADVLLTARRTRQGIDELPAGLRPRTLDEAYAIQDILCEAFGTIGGWKVGRASADAGPVFAPIPLLGGFVPGGATLANSMSRYRGVEAEIAFLLGDGLPSQALPYSREEAIGRIVSCHPAIEVLETAYTDPETVDRFSRIADLQLNGGFAYGSPFAQWQTADFAAETASMSVDGVVRIESPSPAGFDPVGLLTWLANQPRVARLGGLKAGAWVTTGSWTGTVSAGAESTVIARFSSFGECRLSFE